MEQKKPFLYDLFIPKQESNTFTFDRYIKEIEESVEGNGPFRDQWCLGVLGVDGGKWLLKDFTQEPNALFIGAMGSGKSFAAAFSASTWFASNSDQTIMFVIDPLKGANDYSALFDFPQVYPIRDGGGMDPAKAIPVLIDIIYSEVMARKDLFNSVNATNIKNYEKITGKSMARTVMIFEEFHSIPYQLLEFDSNFKKEHTPAAKFLKILRVGRTYGVWVLAASQKSTKSDIPSELIPGFTQKQMFKVSQGEAAYVLGDTRPAMLKSDQKGRCFTDFGEVQFPKLSVPTQQKILKRFAKPLKAECAYLTDQIIKDSLAGKTNKEIYKHRPLSELTEGIEAFDGELVVEILHEKLGHGWTAIDSLTDSFGICGVAEFDGQKRAIMFKNSNKVSSKSMSNLVRACVEHGCEGGILYSLGDGLSSSIYKFASSNRLLIIDHEDLGTIGRQIDAGKIDSAKVAVEKLVITDEDDGNEIDIGQQYRDEKVRKPDSRGEAKFVDHTSTTGELKPKVEIDKKKIETKSSEEPFDKEKDEELLKPFNETGAKFAEDMTEEERAAYERSRPKFEKKKRTRRTSPMPDFSLTDIDYAALDIDARAKGMKVPFGTERAEYLYRYNIKREPVTQDDFNSQENKNGLSDLETMIKQKPDAPSRRRILREKAFSKLSKEPSMVDLPQTEEEWNKLLDVSKVQISEAKLALKARKDKAIKNFLELQEQNK